MIDIKYVRENPDVVRASQIGRGEDPTIVDRLLVADQIRRTAIVEFETLRMEQNLLSGQVAKAGPDNRPMFLEMAKELSTKVKAADSRRAEAEASANEFALLLSNVLDPAAPIGGEENFVVLEHIGTPRDFSKQGFEPKDHVELGRVNRCHRHRTRRKSCGISFLLLNWRGRAS